MFQRNVVMKTNTFYIFFFFLLVLWFSTYLYKDDAQLMFPNVCTETDNDVGPPNLRISQVKQNN